MSTERGNPTPTIINLRRGLTNLNSDCNSTNFTFRFTNSRTFIEGLHTHTETHDFDPQHTSRHKPRNLTTTFETIPFLPRRFPLHSIRHWHCWPMYVGSCVTAGGASLDLVFICDSRHGPLSLGSHTQFRALEHAGKLVVALRSFSDRLACLYNFTALSLPRFHVKNSRRLRFSPVTTGTH